MLLLLVILGSLVTTSLAGYLVHRALHARWSGPLFRAHMDHHLAKYPPSMLMTTAYNRAAWYNSGTFLFTPPLVCLLAVIGGLLWWLGVAPWAIAVFSVVMVAYAVGNDWLHDTFHIKGHWLGRFSWWSRLREEHFVHHRNMKRNYGIVSFEWDRLLKTFKDAK